VEVNHVLAMDKWN
jgi:hypothetical protein